MSEDQQQILEKKETEEKLEEAKIKAEEEAKIKAEEEAKRKAEEEAKIKAEWKRKAKEQAEKKAEEVKKLKAVEAKKEELKKVVKFGMSDITTIRKVLDALEYKGGTSTIPKLKVSTMLTEEILKEALRSGILLGIIDIQKEDYTLNKIGLEYINQSSIDKEDNLAQRMLSIEAYKDIIYQTKMKDGKISSKDLAKAFYILGPDIREELRKSVVKCFLSYCVESKVFESNNSNSNPGYILTKNGELHLQKYIDSQKKGKKKSRAPMRIDAELTCSKCGKPINPDFTMCPYCGAPQKGECSNCGKELQPGFKMCPYCGTPR
ncbi:MAG: zinc ribbon domain-containing protein [Promethearchaeota archaeon]